MKILVKQAVKQVQRMRNILVVLAMFVCTSICLGDRGQTITISGDIVNHDKVRDLELAMEPVRYNYQYLYLEQQQHLYQQRWRLQLLKNVHLVRLPFPPPLDNNNALPPLKDGLKLKQQLELLQNNTKELLNAMQYLQSVDDAGVLKQGPKMVHLQNHMSSLQSQESFLQQNLPNDQILEQQLASERQYSDIAGNGDDTDPNSANYGKALKGDIWKDPNNNHLFINPGAQVGNAYGAKMNEVSVNRNSKAFLSMTNNEVIVSGGEFGCGNTNGNIAGAFADNSINDAMNISSNTVIITGGTDIKSVFGGRTKYGTVSSNTVTISNSVKIKENVFGAWIGYGLASSNTVTITSGKVKSVYGGYIYQNGTATLNTVNLTSVTVTMEEVFGAKIGNDGLASSNTVTITSGKVKSVYGGYIVRNGTATENTVNLTGVTATTKDVYGAWIGYGLASNNTVTIISGKVQSVHGGYITEKGTATLNKVNMTGVLAGSDVFGAWITDGLASSNEVTITSGNVRDVHGVYIKHNGLAIDNKVNLTSVTVMNDVHGAMIGRGLASSNTVTITSGTVGWNVYGGYIHQNGTATLNTVNLTSVTVMKNVYGAWIGDGLASSNTVTITSGTVGLNVYGGYIVKNGTATGNKVNLTSVTVRLDVYGAKIVNDERIAGEDKDEDEDEDEDEEVVGDVLASSNTVTITSGTVGWNVYGGYIVKNGTAIGNKVNLSDVDVTWDVYGARIGRGLASSNEVTITGGRVGGDVLGGYVYKDGTATLNKVNLSDVDVKRDVYGAMVGTNKKTEFERAEEEMTESFERVLAHTAKFEKAADKAEFKIFLEATRAEAEIAKTATKAFNSLAEAAAEEADIEAIDEAFEEVLRTLEGIAKDEDEDEDEDERRAERTDGAKRAERKKNIEDNINKVKAEIAKFRGYVIAEIERAEAKRARTYVLASSNTVTITSGKVGRNVFGGYIVRNGTATLNAVNLTSVTATKDVYGAWIGNDGLASNNTVTIINGETVQNVYGGYIVKDGTATGNTVTISGGKVKGNVFGGYVGGNGEATHNTINITATEQSSKQSSELSSPEFSTESILCGGICDPETKSNAVTGNTLNIETKGVVVKGISNFEKYKFNLKDIKPGETVLTATGGGFSWNAREYNYTPACAVDISRSNMNISLHTQGVLNKGDQYTLIKSPHGFKGKVKTKQIDFENEGLLIKYYWDIKIADNKQELIAILADKKIRDEGVARSLSEGYGAGVVCVNNGMDCIFSKMEETEEQSSKSLLGLQRKGEIGAFGGVAANKSSYNKGSHIDMIGMSMMGGVGVRVEVGRKELSSKEQSSKEQNSKEQNPSEQSSEQSSPELSSKKPSSKELVSELTVGVFAEHGTGNSDVHCKKESKCESKYIGGGLLGRYNIYENEFSGTKLYGEVILRAGQIDNNFNIKEAKKDGTVKEYKYEYADAMYGGCAVGVGYKHKVSEKIDLDWSLRYMFGYQGGKGAKQADVDGNKAKFESVTSNRIRIGVRGKYVELEKIKPYAGIGCEYELDGKVKGTLRNGVDMLNIPASDFGGVTGIGELGVSGKIWKFGVDISGQGYLGVRKGFGGMLKLKYAFGKDAHGSLASSKASSLASSKAPRS